jgi:hypothetical protein
MALDLLNPKTALDLGNIRYTLIRLEDTIIFNLIERAQFPLNRSVYVAGAVPLPDFEGSFLDWLLSEVERTHGSSPINLMLMSQLKFDVINLQTSIHSHPIFQTQSSLLFSILLYYTQTKTSMSIPKSTRPT